MRKTQPRLSPVNSQDAVFAGVFVLAEISRSEPLSANLRAAKDIRTKLSLRRHPYRALTGCHPLPCGCAFKSPQSKVTCGYAV